jgi:hypothetical protein
MKACITCKRELPLRMFFTRFSQHGDTICRDCFADARLQRQAARRNGRMPDHPDSALAHPVGEARVSELTVPQAAVHVRQGGVDETR